MGRFPALGSGGPDAITHGRTHPSLEIGPHAQAEIEALAARVHPIRDLGASVASGSYPVAGMIVAPCSMRSLAAIAHGPDYNLLTRAAGVQLKERRPLILLAREAPLTLAHLRNMMAVAEMGGHHPAAGACLLPAPANHALNRDRSPPARLICCASPRRRQPPASSTGE